MATEKQLAAMAKAREARAASKLDRESEAARAAETTEIIEQYLQESRDDGFDELTELPRNRVVRTEQESRFVAPDMAEPPPLTEYHTNEPIRKIVLTAGRGDAHFIIDLEEGTWEARSSRERGDVVFRGSGDVMAIDCDDLTKSGFGHLERDGRLNALVITRYDRVRDIQVHQSTIRETRSAYTGGFDEAELFASDDDGNVAFSLEEDSSDLTLDLESTEDEELPDVSLKTFYGDEDAPDLDTDGDDSGELVTDDLLTAMDESDADLVDIAELQDDNETEDDPTLSTGDDEEGDDGYYGSSLKPPNPLKG